MSSWTSIMTMSAPRPVRSSSIAVVGVVRVQHLGAPVEGDLGGGRELAREISDDQNTHGVSSRRPSS